MSSIDLSNKALLKLTTKNKKESFDTSLKKELCYKYIKQIEENVLGPWEARWCLEDLYNIQHDASEEIASLADNCLHSLWNYAKQKGFINKNVDFVTFCNKGLVLLISDK